jgi:hypothetical protein
MQRDAKLMGRTKFEATPLFVENSLILSGLKRSSQQPDQGGCDEDSEATFGSVWAGAIVVARSTLRGRTR